MPREEESGDFFLDTDRVEFWCYTARPTPTRSLALTSSRESQKALPRIDLAYPTHGRDCLSLLPTTLHLVIEK